MRRAKTKLVATFAFLVTASFVRATIVYEVKASYSSFLIQQVRAAKLTIELRASDIGPHLIQEMNRAASRGVRISLIVAKEPAQLKNRENISFAWPDTWDVFPQFDAAFNDPFAGQIISYHSGMVVDGKTMMLGMNQDITNEKEDLTMIEDSSGGMSFLAKPSWEIRKIQ